MVPKWSPSYPQPQILGQDASVKTSIPFQSFNMASSPSLSPPSPSPPCWPSSTTCSRSGKNFFHLQFSLPRSSRECLSLGNRIACLQPFYLYIPVPAAVGGFKSRALRRVDSNPLPWDDGASVLPLCYCCWHAEE